MEQILSNNSELELSVIENLMSLRSNAIVHDKTNVGHTLTDSSASSKDAQNSQRSMSPSNMFAAVPSSKSFGHANYTNIFGRNPTSYNNTNSSTINVSLNHGPTPSHASSTMLQQQSQKSNCGPVGSNTGNHYMYPSLRAVSFDRGHPPNTASAPIGSAFHAVAPHPNFRHPQPLPHQYHHPQMMKGYPVSVIPTPAAPSTSTDFGPEPSFLDLTTEQVTELLGDTDLVKIEDRHYVPDYLFLSMAQLKPCKLVESDRTGVYKARDVGFLGLCCKYCGGEPGKGRYFPQTIRSLSQTTTSATIAKHIAQKCGFVPASIKNAVNTLKKEQDWLDKLAKDKITNRYDSRPKYGSRKVFFEQFWVRLHGEDAVLSTSTLEDEEEPSIAHAVSSDSQTDEYEAPQRAIFQNSTNSFSTSIYSASSDGGCSGNSVSPPALIKRKLSDDNSYEGESSNSDIENNDSHFNNKIQKILPQSQSTESTLM